MPNKKTQQLENYLNQPAHDHLTTAEGTKLPDNHHSLKAGSRGPTLLEDVFFRQKMTHFDHERIPERIVHARGFGAHGYFQATKSLAEITCADFLCQTDKKTPVFIRFSTVAGNMGSSELARDVRGFAVKFYTDEGNFDLVGNNIPVFFIQDAMKFPDLVHAVKQEPHNNMPQAASAHDTFYDFLSLMPEAIHMHMWQMSDRTIPRSVRMMEGFGVHTYRLLTREGKSHFVKWHWKPKLGLASVLWDEAQKISGLNPDFLNEDLWINIEKGNYPEWTLALQIFSEEEAEAFPFDVLDPTKIVPEELVPLTEVGKLVLDRNVDNFFAETEQVAFHPGNIVPGIDFSNDPLLQGRLFSYADTQLIRLGGPNFAEIPINRPVTTVNNNQRDGFHRQRIDRGRVAYEPNSLAKGCPFAAGRDLGAFLHYAEKIEAHKVRQRSDSFRQHFTQATLFYNSQTEVEKQHIIEACSFEVSKCTEPHIRERMVQLYYHVDRGLAEAVARNLGVAKVDGDLSYLEESSAPFPSDVGQSHQESSDALSILKNAPQGIQTAKVAVLVAEGFQERVVAELLAALQAEGAEGELVGPHLGPLRGAQGSTVEITKSFSNCGSPLYDGVVLVGSGESYESLASHPQVAQHLLDAFRHKKPLGAAAGAEAALRKLCPSGEAEPIGLVLEIEHESGDFSQRYVSAMRQHRFWERPEPQLL